MPASGPPSALGGRQTDLARSHLDTPGPVETAQFGGASMNAWIGHAFRMAARTALHQGSFGALLHPRTAGPSRIGGDQDRVGRAGTCNRCSQSHHQGLIPTDHTGGFR
jgi:hypothetical protein